MLRILLHGYQGRMGKMILELVKNQPDLEISAGVDEIERSSGETFPVYTVMNDCDMPADVILDFNHHSNIPAVLAYAVARGIPLVIGTTSIPPEVQEQIDRAARQVAVFQSPNLSLGVNLIAALLKKIAPVLYGEGFDIEIIERHHNQKLDAPSGTALMLARTAREAVDDGLRLVFDRSGVQQKRDRREIGMHALRGGTITGEHEVVFAGRDEVIELKHIAQSRELFGVGALAAARFLAGKPAGKYDMTHLMAGLL